MAVTVLAFLPVDHTHAPVTAQAQQPAPHSENQGTYDHPQVPPKPSPQPRGMLYNCYLYVKYIYPALPPTATIRASLRAEPAEVAVFDYAGTPHYAVVEEVGTSTISISETNWNPGEITKRVIPMSDPRLIGYFDIQ